MSNTISHTDHGIITFNHELIEALKPLIRTPEEVAAFDDFVINLIEGDTFEIEYFRKQIALTAYMRRLLEVLIQKP